MEKITIGEFTHNTNKYLVPGKYILTKHGKEVFTVTVELYKQEVPEDSPEPTDRKEFVPDRMGGMCKVQGCFFVAWHKGYCKTHWEINSPKKEVK